MRFYNHTHQFYVGIDLHARQMYVCVIDHEGQTRLHKNLPTDPDNLKKALDAFGTDLVVAVECVFSWYWIADFCEDHDIDFVLGHALYMKAIHGVSTSCTISPSYSPIFRTRTPSTIFLPFRSASTTP
jgi:hypothetical protein